jgi:hypothetical protein
MFLDFQQKDYPQITQMYADLKSRYLLNSTPFDLEKIDESMIRAV